MSDPPTFVCRDCGVPVYDALGVVRERCHPCLWVSNIPDAVERERVRAWLIEVGAIDEAPVDLITDDGFESGAAVE